MGEAPTIFRYRSISQVWSSSEALVQSKYKRLSTTIAPHVEEGRTITVLATRLLYYLGFGFAWVIMFLRLILFALPLSCAWYQMIKFYYCNPHIKRDIEYGPHKRNFLDLYIPHSADGDSTTTEKKKHPVFVFVSGGAWIIGYKAWGALFGKALAQCGVLVVTPDYRNFPQGFVSDMTEDVDNAMKWVFANIEFFGGDSKNVYLCGQSAGAHLSAYLLIEKSLKESLKHKHDGEKLNGRSPVKRFSVIPTSDWKPSQIRAFIGISGPYDLVATTRLLYRKGLGKRLIHALFESPQNILEYSPIIRAKRDTFKKNEVAVEAMPRVHLFHGTADNSAPFRCSAEFAEALQEAGVEVSTKFYDGKTHTDPIIEDPMSGGKDLLISDILKVMVAKGGKVDPTDTTILGPHIEPMASPLVIKLSKIFNPF